LIFSVGHKFDVEQIEEVEADVAVIGSGAGGAVTAKELAEIGYKVAIIEEGHYFKTEEDFNLDPVDSFAKLYRDAGQKITLGSPNVMLPIGCSVGGSSTIFSGTCLRAPSRVLKRWQWQLGLTEIDESEMELLYKAVEEYLFVQRADPEVAGENARLFLNTAVEKMGLSGGWLPRSAKDCEGFGGCVLGCPSGAKQSMNVSYIPGALEAGAQLYTRCRAERIMVENGRAAGVDARFLHMAETGESPRRLRVNSRVVILAGGAIYTPLLLLNQGICNSSGMVGKNLHIHPSLAVVSEMDRYIGNPRGIPQSSYVDEFEADGVMLEGGTVAPSVHAMALPYNGRKHREHMKRYPYSGVFGGMVSEAESEGSVSLTPRIKWRPLVKYNLKGIDLERAKLAVTIMARIWFAAGARKVITPIKGYKEITNPQDLRDLEQARLVPEDFTYLSAFHPMGTCRMGASPIFSVVKHTCETWDLKNMYIVDGSIIPTALGVNPMLTIAALAMRSAGFIDERLSGAEE